MFIAGIAVLITGTVMAILGLIFRLVGKSPYTGQTQGKVIDMCMNAYAYNNGGSGNVSFLVSTGSGSAGTRCPVLEYMVDGIVYRRASQTAYNCSYLYKMIGQPRTIYYDPLRPERASISSKSVLAIVGVVFLIVGAVLAVLGLIFLLL